MGNKFFKCLRCSNISCFTHGHSFTLFKICFNFTAASLSSAVSAVMLQPYINRLNLFNILKLSARYVSCCNQRTYWLMVSLFQTKKLVILFSVETLSSEPYHETANKLQYEKPKFCTHCPCHCIVQYLMGMPNGNINESGALLTTSVCLCIMQWLFVYNLDTVFIFVYFGLHC